jgi:hypothetical protein
MKDSRSKKENSDPNHYLRWVQLCEILCVVAFTFGGGLLWQGMRVAGSSMWLDLLAVMLLAFCVLCFLVAARYSSRADELTKEIAKRSSYLISPHRIETLRQVKAPKDVTDVLKTMDSVYSEDDLLGHLRRELGAERTKEIKDLVLKYTKVTPEPSEGG